MVWRVFGVVLFWGVLGLDVLGLVAGAFAIPAGTLTMGALTVLGTDWFGQPCNTRVMASFSASVTHSWYFFFTPT